MKPVIQNELKKEFSANCSGLVKSVFKRIQIDPYLYPFIILTTKLIKTSI